MQQIEAGLTDIRAGQNDAETINAVFRGVHSVKGGAGIFGFDQLVGFAHVFETVLDGLRNGSLTATPENLDVLLSSSNSLPDLVIMTRSGETAPANFGSENSLRHSNISSRKAAAARVTRGGPAPAEFEDLDFVPVAIDMDDAPAEAPAEASDGMRSYAITFRPKPEMLKKANEPLYVLRELRKLGKLGAGSARRSATGSRRTRKRLPISLVDWHPEHHGGGGLRSTRSLNSWSATAILRLRMKRRKRRRPPSHPRSRRSWPASRPS